MMDSFLDASIGGPELTSISDAELFKYFLNDDIDEPTSSPYSQAVPSVSPPFCESPPLTPESIFSDMGDISFAIKEEISDQFGMLSPSKSVIGVIDTNDLSPSVKNGKSPKGGDIRKKLESHTLSSEEERQVKRQRRLVKNRESAQLSRMRKKIYIDDLEGKVNALTTENSSLKEEVMNLQNALKNITNGSYDAARPAGTVSPASVIGTSGLTRHTRNAQAAGVCLLIVLFSLGLLFNATTTANNDAASNSSSPTSEHRHRRESAQFPVGLLNSISPSATEKIEEIIKEETFTDVSSVAARPSVSQKRPAGQDGDEQEEDIFSSPKHKKIKTEPASPVPTSSRDVDDMSISECEGVNFIEEHAGSAPVAIAVVAPTQTDIIPHADLAFLSNYRSVNVHVWPMLR